MAAARQGKRVVRLNCGDPGVFARSAEEAGIPFEIVPGVTAASAAAAAMGGFLTESGACDKLIFVTGQWQAEGRHPDWQTFLQPGTRIAVFMGVGNAHDIADALEATGHTDEIRIDIVSRAQLPDQIITHWDVPDLVQTIERDKITNPAILFITRSYADIALRRAQAHLAEILLVQSGQSNG